MFIYQRTIQRSVQCTGIGLHSGKKVCLTLRPAAEDEGVTLVRSDLPGRPRISAVLDNVIDTHHATTIGNRVCSISTVEHIMAAVRSMGIDNIDIEVDAPEVPIMDGSAAPFIFLLKTAGTRTQHMLRRFIFVRKPIVVEDNDKSITLTPASSLTVDYDIDFDHPLIRHQRLGFAHSVRAFEKEISRARTFGFLEEVELLKKNGLALGGSLANAVVLGDFNVLNPDGLRYEDEFVRHKILDFIGDLSLIGAPVIAHCVAHKSGHTLNHMLLKAVKALPSHWVEVRFSEVAQYEEACSNCGRLLFPEPLSA